MYMLDVLPYEGGRSSEGLDGLEFGLAQFGQLNPLFFISFSFLLFLVFVYKNQNIMNLEFKTFANNFMKL